MRSEQAGGLGHGGEDDDLGKTCDLPLFSEGTRLLFRKNYNETIHL